MCKACAKQNLAPNSLLQCPCCNRKSDPCDHATETLLNLITATAHVTKISHKIPILRASEADCQPDFFSATATVAPAGLAESSHTVPSQYDAAMFCIACNHFRNHRKKHRKRCKKTTNIPEKQKNNPECAFLPDRYTSVKSPIVRLSTRQKSGQLCSRPTDQQKLSAYMSAVEFRKYT